MKKEGLSFLPLYILLRANNYSKSLRPHNSYQWGHHSCSSYFKSDGLSVVSGRQVGNDVAELNRCKNHWRFFRIVSPTKTKAFIYRAKGIDEIPNKYGHFARQNRHYPKNDAFVNVEFLLITRHFLCGYPQFYCALCLFVIAISTLLLRNNEKRR
jgi:hypothetical protein